MRVASTTDEEYRIWITRLFLKKIWSHLAKCLRKNAEAQTLANASNSAEAGPETEKTKFGQAFRDDNATYPLGSTPFLASEMDFDTLKDDIQRLTFREGRERRLPLLLTPELLEAFCSMLRAAADKAQWMLNLDYDLRPAPAPVATSPSRLH